MLFFIFGPTLKKEVKRIMMNIVRARKWTIGVTALVLTTFLGAAGPALADRPGVGAPAPNFTLNDIYGVSHTLSDYWGTVIVLAFMTPT